MRRPVIGVRELTAEDTERAERGLRGRVLVERNYSWDQIATAVVAACCNGRSVTT